MAFFPVHQVDRSRAEQFEQLGSKPKFWFVEGTRRLLFKADDRGTGEDWAEVIACQLCELLGLPHVEYKLAEECEDDQILRPGVICENMAHKPFPLVLGNELLFATDPQYPTGQRFKVRQHSVVAVADMLQRLEVPSDVWMTGSPDVIQSALDVFVGYIMLDAWIANQDRHHENWGALWDGKAMRLAPTFDHGAGLARNLTDNERSERLSTKDRNRTVAAFAQRGRSAFYLREADNQPLLTLDAFLAFGKRSSVAKDSWLKQLLAVNRERMWGILEQVPQERMSPVCKEFTLELLLENQRRLLD